MNIASCRPIITAIAIAAAGLPGCDRGPDARANADGLSYIKRGDGLYAAGRYTEAGDAYSAAVKTLDGKDTMLFAEAATRANNAFCMAQFTGARKLLAAGDTQLAFLQIDTALSQLPCNAFTEEVNWAKEQKRLREPRK